MSVLYPGLWALIQKILIAFPSSYMAECGFTVVANSLSKKRNGLHITDGGDLRLLLWKMESDINKLLKLIFYFILYSLFFIP